MNTKPATHLLVISSYPLRGETHGRKIVGGAMAAKNTLTALKKEYPQLDITVLAEELDKNVLYTEDGIKVKRIWQRKSFMTFPKLLNQIITREKSTNNILIEMELSNFGNILHLLPFPLFLVALKLLRKNVTIVFQQVIDDMDDLSGHMNIQKKSLKSKLFTIGIRNFYKISLALSTKSIVFEEVLKKRLRTLSPQADVVVIPFGVESITNPPSKQSARKNLGLSQNEFIVLSFGFIAWYKGTDWLTKSFIKYINITQSKNAHLILAGGPNPNHLDKLFYKKYLKDIEADANSNPITITGFIPEEKIGDYFAAADVVVLPYRTLMSSSGPLSLALSYKKPLLLSESLKELLLTNDSEKTRATHNIARNELFFSDDNSFIQLLEKIQKNPSLQKKLTAYSASLAEKRQWQFLAQKYYEELSA